MSDVPGHPELKYAVWKFIDEALKSFPTLGNEMIAVALTPDGNRYVKFYGYSEKDAKEILPTIKIQNGIEIPGKIPNTYYQICNLSKKIIKDPQDSLGIMPFKKVEPIPDDWTIVVMVVEKQSGTKHSMEPKTAKKQEFTYDPIKQVMRQYDPNTGMIAEQSMDEEEYKVFMEVIAKRL